MQMFSIWRSKSPIWREIETRDESVMNERFQLDKLEKQHRDLVENRNSEYQAQIIQANKDLKLKRIQATAALRQGWTA